MHKISKAVNRADSPGKASGKTKYISDIHKNGMLNMSIKVAEFQHGFILSINKPELPSGYFCITGADFKGMNRASIVAQDWPFFAEEEILYYGQAILAYAGPELKICEQLCIETKIEYSELPAVSSFEDSLEHFNDYTIIKGKPDQSFLEAHRCFENNYRTGMQEQAYMEPQGMMAEFKDGVLTVHGSMQCPYYIKNSLMNAFALGENEVRVVQSETGGAFGGKEDYPSIISGQVAAAAIVTGQPVKIILDRRNDMMVTPKRHPSLISIKTAVDKEGNITAMDIDCRLDAGAYQTLSGVVLERAIFISTGAYNIENVRVRGRTMKTNHVPSGAFRGFGGPQALFAAGMNMYYLSRKLKIRPLEFKRRYLYRQGDLSVTGGTFRDEIKLDEMIEKIEAVSNYSRRWLEYENASTSNSNTRRGIGISFAAHGGAFTGNGEQELIKSLVRLEYKPGNPHSKEKVHIFVSNVEMGQGASTTLRKIVAEEIEIPLQNIVFTIPDTAIVPDSGPTVASLTIMIVGKLLQDAASDLKIKIKNNPENKASSESRYVHPEEFIWDEETFTGDAYPAYSWSVNVVEVELDLLTYEIKLTGSWAAYDVGTPIDIKILTGQMQGGTVQSLGYCSIEKMQMIGGKPGQASFTDYTIPTTLDFPDTECIFVDNPYRYGPFGAKAAGELPNEGPAAAFASAVSQACGRIISEIPILPETLEAEAE